MHLKWMIAGLAVGMGLSTPLAAFAESLSLEEVWDKAIKASYDLKIAQTDIEISKTDILAARSEYFPVIQSRFNLEYLKDLESSGRPVTAVGNTVIPAGTRYQNSLGFTMQQKLVDFGARKRRVEIARKDTLAKAALFDQSLRDLKIKLVDLYTEALLNAKAIKANEAVFTLAQQAYQMKKRLYTAGNISKVEVATEAIQVAQALNEIETFKQQLDKALQDLSHYTQEPYEPANIDLAELQEETGTLTVVLNLQQTPEARLHDAQIDQKEQEIEFLKRQNLPQISLYSNYNLYGFDPQKLGKSLADLSQRTVSVGLSVPIPVFDGFRNKAVIQKAGLEREKLVLQKTKTLAELKHRADTLRQQAEAQGILLRTQATILNKTQDKLTLETRLSEQQLIDKTQAIQDHIARIHRQLDTEKSLIQGIASLIKLRILETSS